MKNTLLSLFVLSVFALTAQKPVDSIALTNAAFETQIICGGVKYQHFHFTDSSFFNAKENINLLRVSRKANCVAWAFGTDYDSLLRTSVLAQKYNALAAINGSFFDVKKGGAVDFIKIQGKVIDTSRNNGVKLPEHQQAALVIENGILKIIHACDSLDVDWQKTLSSYSDVMVTGPWLLQNGIKNDLAITPFNKNRHPRSGVCFTEDEIILITVDGRTSESYGMTLNEFTTVMQWLGSTDGINLDGGGSTTLFVNGAPENGVVNMPCDNKKFDHAGERAVSNIIMLLPTAAKN